VALQDLEGAGISFMPIGRAHSDAIQGHPKAINTELTRLVEIGEIVKIRRGVYTLPKT